MDNHGLSGLYCHRSSPNDYDLLRFYPDGEGCSVGIWGAKDGNDTLEAVMGWFGRDLRPREEQLFTYEMRNGRLDFWFGENLGEPFHMAGRLDGEGRLLLDQRYRGIILRSGKIYEFLGDGPQIEPRRWDIQSASAEELATVPGLTKPIAMSIVEEREQCHRFKDPQALLEVRGFTAKVLNEVGHRLLVDGVRAFPPPRLVPKPPKVPGPPASGLGEVVLDICKRDPFHQPVHLDERTFVQFWRLANHYQLRQLRDQAVLGWNLRYSLPGSQVELPPIEKGLGRDLVEALVAMFSSVSDEQLATLSPERPVLRIPYDGLSRWWGFDALVVLHPKAATMHQVKNDVVLPQVTYLVAPCYACEFGSLMSLPQATAQQADINWSDATREPHPALSLVSYPPPKKAPKKLKERKPYNTKKTRIGAGWAGKWHELENAWGRILRLVNLEIVEIDPQNAQPIGPPRTASTWNDVQTIVTTFLNNNQF